MFKYRSFEGLRMFGLFVSVVILGIIAFAVRLFTLGFYQFTPFETVRRLYDDLLIDRFVEDWEANEEITT